MEATEAIASMPPGHCLGSLVIIPKRKPFEIIPKPTLEMLQWKLSLLPRRKCLGASTVSKTKHTGLVIQCMQIMSRMLGRVERW